MRYKGFGSLEETYIDLILREAYIPLGIVPFATDDGGNFFCISTRKDDFDYVYYCNNDHYNINNREECLTILTENFKDFINDLKP